MPASRKTVTKAMLEDLAVRQQKELVERDKFLKKLIADLKLETEEKEKWKKAYVVLGEDYNELEEISIELSKRFIGFYNDYLKVYELNRKLGIQNQEFLTDRNDVIRKYNFFIECKKVVDEAERKGWTKKLPEYNKYKMEDFKAEVLESGKVRYKIKLKDLTLKSGKKIKIADKEDN